MSGYSKRSGWDRYRDYGLEWAGRTEDLFPTTRVRRGKVVTIPPEWRGEVTRPQTIRKRDSKRSRKERMARQSHGWSEGHPRNWPPRHTSKQLLVHDDADG